MAGRFKQSILIAALSFLAVASSSGTAQAAIDCKIIKPELQQIHALLTALESSEGDAQGHFAVATGLLRRLQSVGREAKAADISSNVDKSVRLLQAYLASMEAERLASGTQSGHSQERTRLAGSVRNAIQGIQCTDTVGSSSEGEGRAGDGMANRLLQAGSNSASSGEEATPFGVGLVPKGFALSFPRWTRSSGLALNVAIIIFSCLLALAIVEIIERRRQTRFATNVPAMVHYGGRSFDTTIFDLSTGGARLSAMPGAKTGDRISITLAEQKLPAEIRWLGDKCIGVKFDRKLDRFKLMRVQSAGLLKEAGKHMARP